MGLQPGTRLGLFEILSLIGSGGMGEVYRARDLKLNRDVAIKVLPDHLARDAGRLARLQREAQLLAALNHPHIAHIHGLEDSTGVSALVLELVEGPTLAARIAQGPLPVPEALDLGRQIADALESAHDKGVIHRDLKPANIKIAAQGTVKVLDFGIAKAVLEDPTCSSDASFVTAEATEAGMLVGTAAYMSPEQARGQAIDKRTDIWAFGCVMFEMLSGERPFDGDTVSDTIATVLTREPDWSHVSGTVPPAVMRLLRRCLEKDVRRRLRDIGDARIDLEDAGRDPREAPGPTRSPPVISRRTAIAAIAGGAAGVVVTSAFTIGRYRGSTPRHLTRFAIAMPSGELHSASFNSRVGMSHGGGLVAFNTQTPTGPRLYTRSLADLESKWLKDLGAGASPFFSPDDRWLGFFVPDQAIMRKAALSGGAPVTVSAIGGYAGATWADDDTIYFVSDMPGGILQVPAGGGQPVELATIDTANGERVLKFPHALPGGKAVLFASAPADAESFDDARIGVVSTADGARKVLIEGGTHPRYSTSGHLLYARNGNLLAVRFDPDRLQVSGQPVTVLEGVLMSRNTGVANFDVARNGDLVYIPGIAEGGARTLVWVDRRGNAERVPLPARSYLHPRLAPDGRKVTIEIEGPDHDIYVYDFQSGVLSNLTADGVSHWPVWSHDGESVGYRAGPMGRFQMWELPADRSRSPQQVPAPGFSLSLESYSPDGRAVAYTSAAPGAPSRVTVAPLEGERAPRTLDNSMHAQGSPKFSPDGRWLAYCSNESGTLQVYVQAFPGPGAKVQVSNEGGTDPAWRRDGAELFYRKGDSMMSVPVTIGPRFGSARPQELWRGHYSHGMSSSCGPPGPTSSNYDVTPDGERFLMIKDDDQDSASSSEVVVVLGWADELHRLSQA